MTGKGVGVGEPDWYRQKCEYEIDHCLFGDSGTISDLLTYAFMSLKKVFNRNALFKNFV